MHRGPDDYGELIDEGLALGFRRLAILDLTETGRQPMTSASGRWVIVFNGEVYNFESLRRELRAETRGRSDTEVMLAAIESWGLENAVRRFVGMFAFALWDRRERTLHLVRDRMGVKPMYYGFANGTFLFGSELEALRRHPDFDSTLDRDAVAAYLRFLYVPTPMSIYRAIRKQTPGTILTLRNDTLHTTTYWSAADVAERGIANRFSGTEQEAVQTLDALLRDAIDLRMVADVPLGVFLSGGIDSSLVTALMQTQSARPVKTFTIGFADASYDEAKYAAAVARHLGTDHTEWYVTPKDAMDVIPKLPAMYDEPFADSSQIPTHLVSAMARRHVTVSLSGEGGDELFGGYRRYFEGQRVLRLFGHVPAAVRRATGSVIDTIPARAWQSLLGWREPQAATQMARLARALRSRDLDSLYAEVVSHWAGDVVIGATTPLPLSSPISDPIERMMFFDQVSYLPDDILAKVDRASMAVSLEAREPLLDHRVVEFSWALPLEMKVRGGTGKRVLRAVLERYVPRALTERPKMGFKVPIESWIAGSLRDWAADLLDERTLRQQGLLNVSKLKARSADETWALLMLQAWLREVEP